MFPVSSLYDPVTTASLALAFFWTVEHFAIQQSLFHKSPPITLHPFAHQAVRLILNFLAAIFIISVCDARFLTICVIVDFMISSVIIAYQQYFKKPFVPHRHLGQMREGIKAAMFAIRIVPFWVWLGMLIALVLKLWLTFQIPPQESKSLLELKRAFAVIAPSLLAAIVLLLQFTSFRFISIKHTSITRIIFAYGYVISWIANSFFSLSAKQLAAEAASIPTGTPDRLAADEIPYDIKNHIVVLQVESLDWNILHYSMNGVEVTPCINQLAAKGLLYKVAAYHQNGTADMDYALLSGRAPSQRMINYSIPDISYDDSLPRFMHKHGYRTVSMHGATGDYYRRRDNFQKMGWGQSLFREDFKSHESTASYWGIRDRELLSLSSMMLNAAKQPEFHFLITLDSHGPFNLISGNEKTVFPNSRNWRENYFNSMALFDRQLQDYMKSIPPDTLLMIYGDHSSGVNYGGFHPAHEGTNEYVPCIVCLAAEQLPDVDSAKTHHVDYPTDLRVLDVINSIRRKILIQK